MKGKIKKIIPWIAFVNAILIGGLMLINCSTFGTLPDGDNLSRIEKSPQYNREKGQFDNRVPDLVEKMYEENMNWSNVREWFSARENSVPDKRLPEIKPDVTEFNRSSDNIKVIWFGHSSIHPMCG